MKPEDDFDMSELSDSLEKLRRKKARRDELTGGKPKAPTAPPEEPLAPSGPAELPATE